MAVAEIHDPRTEVAREGVRGVAFDGLAARFELHRLDRHQASFEVLAQLAWGDDLGLRQRIARAHPLHAELVWPDFQESVEFADFSGDDHAVPNFWGGAEGGPVVAGVDRHPRGGVLHVADRTEVGATGHDACNGHDVADTVVLADVKDVFLGVCAPRHGRGHGQGETRANVHGCEIKG